MQLSSNWKLGLGFSLLAGGLTLVLMLTPIMTVGFLIGLDSVPRALREECLSLGVTRWQALWLQVIPAARPALLAGLALAVGRAVRIAGARAVASVASYPAALARRILARRDGRADALASSQRAALALSRA